MLTLASLMFYLVLFLTVPIAVQLMYAIVCENQTDQQGQPVVDGNNSSCDSSSEVSSQVSAAGTGTDTCSCI